MDDFRNSPQAWQRSARAPPQPRGLERLARVAVRLESDCRFWGAWPVQRAQGRERDRWAVVGRSSHQSAMRKHIDMFPKSMPRGSEN